MRERPAYMVLLEDIMSSNKFSIWNPGEMLGKAGEFVQDIERRKVNAQTVNKAIDAYDKYMRDLASGVHGAHQPPLKVEHLNYLTKNLRQERQVVFDRLNEIAKKSGKEKAAIYEDLANTLKAGQREQARIVDAIARNVKKGQYNQEGTLEELISKQEGSLLNPEDFSKSYEKAAEALRKRQTADPLPVDYFSGYKKPEPEVRFVKYVSGHNARKQAWKNQSSSSKKQPEVRSYTPLPATEKAQYDDLIDDYVAEVERLEKELAARPATAGGSGSLHDLTKDSDAQDKLLRRILTLRDAIRKVGIDKKAAGEHNTKLKTEIDDLNKRLNQANETVNNYRGRLSKLMSIRNESHGIDKM